MYLGDPSSYVEGYKYLLHSPKNNKTYFIGSGALFNDSTKNIINNLIQNNPDLIPIQLDSGRYDFSYPYDQNKSRADYLDEGMMMPMEAHVFGIRPRD